LVAHRRINLENWMVGLKDPDGNNLHLLQSCRTVHDHAALAGFRTFTQHDCLRPVVRTCLFWRAQNRAGGRTLTGHFGDGTFVDDGGQWVNQGRIASPRWPKSLVSGCFQVGAKGHRALAREQAYHLEGPFPARGWRRAARDPPTCGRLPPWRNPCRRKHVDGAPSGRMGRVHVA
jgi:hypothetical protein